MGVIKGTSFTVQHYYLPGDEPLDITQSLTMDVFKGRAKVALEPGTAYKFRVAAVNSCGRSAWSEVTNSILYLARYYLVRRNFLNRQETKSASFITNPRFCCR